MSYLVMGLIGLVVIYVARSYVSGAANALLAVGFIAALGVFGYGAFNGTFFYAEPGFKYHVRTILGSETMASDVGYNVYLFGRITPWKNAMTVQASNVTRVAVSAGERETNTTSADLPSQKLVFLDQVDADVTATVRYLLPVDEESFLIMARQYRTPENLLRTELIPAFQETLGANAALMGAEEYFSGGKTQFNNDFENQMRGGVFEVRRRQVERKTIGRSSGSANASLGTDQQDFGEGTEIVFEVSKILDSNGQPIRKIQAFSSFGISVVSARVTNVQPNQAFQERMGLKQEAAANRAIAQERRAQEVQERLLAIEKGEREVAERQAEAKVRQIELTTNALTDKQLVITQAQQRLEQARIDRETASIRLDQAQVDAQARQVAADAESYEKRVLLEADNALQAKLDTYTTVQGYWADAYARRQVPSTLFSGGGGGAVQGTDSDVTNFLRLKTVEAIQDLNLDLNIRKDGSTR